MAVLLAVLGSSRLAASALPTPAVLPPAPAFLSAGPPGLAGAVLTAKRDSSSSVSRLTRVSSSSVSHTVPLTWAGG
eukprot:scaffold3534_cov56-Isochrysis_galbana.AAC.1